MSCLSLQFPCTLTSLHPASQPRPPLQGKPKHDCPRPPPRAGWSRLFPPPVSCLGLRALLRLGNLSQQARACICISVFPSFPNRLNQSCVVLGTKSRVSPCFDQCSAVWMLKPRALLSLPSRSRGQWVFWGSCSLLDLLILQCKDNANAEANFYTQGEGLPMLH